MWSDVVSETRPNHLPFSLYSFLFFSLVSLLYSFGRKSREREREKRTNQPTDVWWGCFFFFFFFWDVHARWPSPLHVRLECPGSERLNAAGLSTLRLVFFFLKPFRFFFVHFSLCRRNRENATRSPLMSLKSGRRGSRRRDHSFAPNHFYIPCIKTHSRDNKLHHPT